MSAYRLPICSGGDVDHRHARGCLPLLVRTLPGAPSGWRYGYGSSAGGWSIWLERVGGGGARWHILGLPAASTVAGLVALVEAYVAGYRGGMEHGPTI